jgi:hypothetical protein
MRQVRRVAGALLAVAAVVGVLRVPEPAWAGPDVTVQSIVIAATPSISATQAIGVPFAAIDMTVEMPTALGAYVASVSFTQPGGWDDRVCAEKSADHLWSCGGTLGEDGTVAISYRGTVPAGSPRRVYEVGASAMDLLGVTFSATGTVTIEAGAPLASDLKVSRFALAGSPGPNPRFQVTVGNDGPVTSPGGTLAISGLGSTPIGDTETSCERSATGAVCKLLAIETGGSLVYDFSLRGNTWLGLTITVTATGSNADPRGGNNSARLGPFRGAPPTSGAPAGVVTPPPTGAPDLGVTVATPSTYVEPDVVQVREVAAPSTRRGFPWLLVLAAAVGLAVVAGLVRRLRRWGHSRTPRPVGVHRLTR